MMFYGTNFLHDEDWLFGSAWRPWLEQMPMSEQSRRKIERETTVGFGNGLEVLRRWRTLGLLDGGRAEDIALGLSSGRAHLMGE